MIRRMTEMTTIKVSRATRDRLRAQARAAHVPIGVHLEHLADAADRQARFAALRAAAERHPLEPDEVKAWERTEWTTTRDR